MLHKIKIFFQQFFTTITLLALFVPIGWLLKQGSSTAFELAVTFSIINIYGIYSIWRKQ